MNVPCTDCPIEKPIPCARCGYLLRGLTAEAACPECGLPIERTLTGDWLVHADQRWRRRVAVALLAASAFVFLAILLDQPLGLWIWVARRLTPTAMSLFATLPIAADGLALICLLGVTWPDRSRTRDAPAERSRRLAQAGLLILLPVEAFGIVTAYGLLRLPTSPFWPLAVLWPTTTVVRLLAVVAVLFWLRDLARRSVRPRRAGFVRLVVLVFAIGTTGLVAVQIIYLIDFYPAFGSGGTGQLSPAAQARMQVFGTIWVFGHALTRFALAVTYAAVGHAVLISRPAEKPLVATRDGATHLE